MSAELPVHIDKSPRVSAARVRAEYETESECEPSRAIDWSHGLSGFATMSAELPLHIDKSPRVCSTSASRVRVQAE
jgi:hypothetical protein